jgi:hypothetical protein
MRKVLIGLVAAGVFVFTAHAALSEPLPGKHTMGEIWQTCLTTEGGIATNGSGPGGFGCKTGKGEVSCKKTGTVNGGSVGTCEGCNPSCSMDAGGGGANRTIDDVLSPPSKAKPFEPMEATGETAEPPAGSRTLSTGAPPMHQLMLQ